MRKIPILYGILGGEKITSAKYDIFASSGACDAEIEIIKGNVIDQITFVSDEFTGTMDSQKFWDDLAAFAKRRGKFVKLVHKRN